MRARPRPGNASPSSSPREPARRNRNAFAARVVAGAVSFLLLAPGCGDDAPAPPRINAIEATLAASQAAAAASVGLEAFGLALLGDVIPGTGAPAPGDTLFADLLACPLATVEGGEEIEGLRFDFGTGCLSGLNGLLTGGSTRLEIDALGPPVRASMDLGGFDRGGVDLSGTLRLSGTAATAITLDAVGFTLVAPAGTVVLTGSFETVVDAEPESDLCLGWRVTSGGGTMDAATAIYRLTLDEPLRGSTCCAYPVRGRLLVEVPGVSEAYIDFGDGTCDNRATLIAGDRELSFTLGPNP